MDNFTNQEIKETENTNTGLSTFTQVEGDDNQKGIMLVAGAAVAGTLVLVGVASKIKKIVRKKLLASLAEEAKEVKPPVVEVEAEVVEADVVEEPVKPVKKK